MRTMIRFSCGFPALGPPGASVPAIRDAVMSSIAGRVRGKAVVAGIFKRP